MMASAAKRPRAAKSSQVEEVVLDVILVQDEDHDGSSSDEENEVNPELKNQSEFSG